MASENDLMNKLLISKKIMEKHNDMGRNGKEEMISNHNSPVVENYEPINANYNLPQEFLMESKREIPNPQVPTHDRIMNSKLPEEIKKLMLEHPIEQPGMGQGPSISNELVEKASRLMGTSPKKQQTVSESKIQEKQPSFNSNEMRSMIRETVEDVLKENGLLVESTTRSDEVFKFRVGNHIFEGKLTKIKKIQK